MRCAMSINLFIDFYIRLSANSSTFYATSVATLLLVSPYSTHVHRFDVRAEFRVIHAVIPCGISGIILLCLFVVCYFVLIETSTYTNLSDMGVLCTFSWWQDEIALGMQILLVFSCRTTRIAEFGISRRGLHRLLHTAQGLMVNSKLQHILAESIKCVA